MKIIENDKNKLEFEIIGEKHTLASLLCWALNEDPKVSSATYDLKHPLVGNPVVIIKTSGKSPKKALEDADKLISKEFDSMKKALSKAK